MRPGGGTELYGTRSIYLGFPGRSCGTAGISGKITEFAKRAGLKHLAGVSRDVARRGPERREREREHRG